MKREWTKPELYIENFELTQTVATSCKIDVDIHPDEPGGEAVYHNLCCEQALNGGGGQGHWEHADVIIPDTDGDGKISSEEWQWAYDNAYKAINGKETGNGHRNHIPGYNDIFDIFGS